MWPFRPKTGSGMNLANRLTLLRWALVPVFMIFTVLDNFWTRVLALLIFAAASLTDAYDGYIARKYNEVTEFGKLMDPLADKFLISAAFICFIKMRELDVAPWMVVLIFGRELLVTGLRLLAASKGQVLSVDRQGKFKTIIQMTVVISILLILCANSFLRQFTDLSPPHILESSPYWLVFISMVATLYSGTLYLYRNRHLYMQDVGL